MGSQIIGPDENRVDPFQAVNGLGIVDAAGRFGLQHDEDFLVGVLVIVGRRRAEIDGVQRTADRTVADGRILGRGDRRLRLFHRVDHRHDDAPSAGIEHALDVIVIAARNPSQGDAAGVGNRAEQDARFAPIDG